MKSKIPSNSDLANWYSETVMHDSFIETLTPYQREKLLAYCMKKKDWNFGLAAETFYKMDPIYYPTELPEENQLEYFISRSMPIFLEINRVFNALGYHWTFKESIRPINDIDIDPKPIEEETPKNVDFTGLEFLNKKCQFFIKTGLTLTTAQMALFCIYEKIVINRPYKDSDIANRIAILFGNTSGNNLYNTYVKYDGHQAQRTKQKSRKESIKDIEKIIPLLSNAENVNKALSDIRAIEERKTNKKNDE